MGTDQDIPALWIVKECLWKNFAVIGFCCQSVNALVLLM